MESQPRTTVVNGIELTSIEQGTGKPVVFVHGSLADYRSWTFQMGDFGRSFRAIAYSRRRHWPNAWPENDDGVCSADVHANDLAGFIEALGIGPCHLVGSSYGAMIALTMTVKRPDLVRSLVLGEPPLLPWLESTPEGASLYDAFQANAWGPAGEAFRSGDLEGGVRLFINGVIGDGAFDRMPLPARASMLDNAREMAVETQTPPERYFPSLTRDQVGAIQAPVLLLTGARSPLMFHRVTDRLESCLPSVERVEIPDTSHSIHSGNPAVYNRTVLAYMEHKPDR